MKEISELHRKAMALLDEATVMRLQKGIESSKAKIRQAFELERSAALMVKDSIDLEPTRSILFRSAASLALQCEETRAAEKLIAIGLAGEPPEEIAEELRDLLEQVYFSRHLSLRGLELSQQEFKMALVGEAVGLGLSEATEVQGRIQKIESIVYRTAERLEGKPYREAGRRSKKLTKRTELYVSEPLAASFALTFRVGTQKQLDLPGVGLGSRVVEEVLDLLDSFSSSKLDELEKKIPERAYLRNFVGLARGLAPDGKNIKTVGFSALQQGDIREIALTLPRSETLPMPSNLEAQEYERVEVRGYLRFADDRKERHEIRLVETDGTTHTIEVPEGMMADIIRPMWDLEVTVSGEKVGKKILLDDIHEVE